MVSELVKQRIVGLVVLVLMMVVIIPWGLNHSEVAPALNQHADSGVKNVMVLNRPSLEVDQTSAREISQHTKASTMQVKKSGDQDSEALHQQTKVMAFVFTSRKKIKQLGMCKWGVLLVRKMRIS